MATTLFNVHDLILLLTSFECLVIALVIYSNKAFHHIKYILFATILLTHSFIALHELVLWGATFRDWVLDFSSNLFFVFNFSYFLDGPLIYLFVVSLLSTQYKLGLKSLVHVIPAIIFLIYMYFAFWHLEKPMQEALIRSYDIAYSWHYVTVDILGKSLRIGYITLAVMLCNRRGRTPKLGPAATPPKLQLLLKIMLTLALWEWLLTAIKVYGLKNSISLNVLEVIGLFDYYAMFGFINLTLYVSFVETVGRGWGGKKAKASEPVNREYVDRILTVMETEKLFLNPNLSIERFSEQIGIPVKDLSITINQYFGVNFYEFINHYRIKEARYYLTLPEHADKSITEIFYNAGFNSKSVYNTLFKKTYHCTPSQYRKRSDCAT